MEHLICQIGMFWFWVTVLFTVKVAEIAADTEPCDVILCSPINNSTDQSVIKYNCGPSKPKVKCSDMLPLLEPSTQSSVPEPNSNQNNCNITIGNTKTDSGSYPFRVDGILNGKKIHMLSDLTTISVKAGHNISLICTDPGLCSGSDPHITWMWTSAGNNENPISNLNLTLTLPVKHNGTKVTCKVNSPNDVITELKGTLHVTFHDHEEKKNKETQGSTVMTNPTAHKSSTTKHLTQTTSSRSKITLTTEKSTTNVQCVISCENETGGDPMKKLLCLIKKTEIIYAFLTGVLLSTILSMIFCCLTGKCCRKKQRAYGNVPEATGRGGPLIVDEGGDVAAGKSDVDYSTIKFSALKRQTVKNSEETTETEYAEIKRGETEEQQAGEGIQEEVLIEEAVLTEVEAVLVVEAEETNHYVPVMGKGEDVVLPSNVTDIVNEI